MKVLVTGANGYIGQGVVQHLLEHGQEVIAAGRHLENVDEHAVKIPADIFALDDPYKSLGEPDILIHLAWRDGFQHYSDAHVEDLPKHYRFLKLMAESGIKKISAMGSMHEVGFYEGSIDETTPCNPTTPYGICKNALRELTEELCLKNNVKFQWLRGFYIVGNSEYGSSIFSKITVAEKQNQKEFPFTKGQNQFDFIDYEAFCEGTVRAVLQDSILGIINICSGHPEKLSDCVEHFIKENGYKIRLKYGAFPDRPYDSKAVWGNSKKLEQIMA